MSKKSDPSLYALCLLAIALGVWATAFGEELEVVYVQRFLLPFLLVYVYGTREFWISTLKDRDGNWATDWRKYLAIVSLMPFFGASFFILLFGLGAVLTEIVLEIFK